VDAPVEVADAHSQFCTPFNGELTALDRMITGIEGKSRRDIELAYRMWARDSSESAGPEESQSIPM
jgi:hypothetical protein